MSARPTERFSEPLLREVHISDGNDADENSQSINLIKCGRDACHGGFINGQEIYRCDTGHPMHQSCANLFDTICYCGEKVQKVAVSYFNPKRIEQDRARTEYLNSKSSIRLADNSDNIFYLGVAITGLFAIWAATDIYFNASS